MNLTTAVLYVHLGSLALAAAGILYADKLGFSWLRGKHDVLSEKNLLRAHYIVSIALISLIATGAYLFWPMHTYLLKQPLFLLKMAFVMALVINSFVIGSIMRITTQKTFASLTLKERVPFLASGAVSTASWVGAGVVALLLFYF